MNSANDNTDTDADKDLPVSIRKLVERALLLPLIGLVLLIPPLASIFEIDARPFGIPFTLLYLFGVWAALIFFAARLSRRLQAYEEPEDNRLDDRIDREPGQ